MRRTLALDLDGVCHNVVEAVIGHVQAKWDIHLKRDLQTMYSLGQWVHAHEDLDPVLRGRIVLDVIARVTRDPFFYWHAVQPYPEAKRAVSRLAERYNIEVITSRPSGLSGVTCRMVARDFPQVRGIHHIKHGNKGRAAKALGCTLAIEDNADEVLEYVKAKVYTCYVRRNYGGEIPGPTRGRVRQVSDVSEAATHIFEIDDRHAMA